ncbi:MAG TPA: sigma-54 dependent transcriptional regulator [Polyangiaceae bacterium]|nr:sigma-54 dependent transcriptional regulator [Polyangiaceae bacterium]
MIPRLQDQPMERHPMNDNELLVCIVDDDVSAREAMAGLVHCAGMQVETFSSAKEYLAKLRAKPPACLLLDVDLPGQNGLDLQEELCRREASIPIVFVTGHADVPMSVRALKAGASDFLTKPFDPDSLLAAIRTAAAKSRPAPASARHGTRRSSEDASPDSKSESFAELVGGSHALAKVLRQVSTVASTDSTVLIHGETGTGKELIARALHNSSERRHGPFVKVNCGAIPAGLLESELMGHEKGAFTGAIAQRIGRFELAQDGTLFLDEIGEIATELQPKLLRLLQEREFERIGGTRTVRTNARLIAATNRDLGAMVTARTFREDLYYRLNVFPIVLPPLRDRRQDIPALAEHFMNQVATRLKKDVRIISAAAITHLTQYDWPGNIRELENVIERAVILANGTTLEIPPLRSSVRPSADGTPHVDDLAAVNKAHILGVLEATRGVVAGPDGAAARLGIKRSTLNYRMKKLGIVRDSARAHGHCLTDTAATSEPQAPSSVLSAEFELD